MPQNRSNAEKQPKLAASEHQDMSQPRKTIALIGRVLSVVIAAMAAFGLIILGTTTIEQRASATAPANTSPPITVNTMTASLEASFTRETHYAGLIEPQRTNRLAFERNGTVVQIMVDEGHSVSQGQIIARLDTRLLLAQSDELKARQKALAAQAELARLTTRRRENLSKEGWTSEQGYDEARLDLARLRAAITEVDAAIESVKVNLDKSVLTAPFSGMIAARHLDEGAIVSAGTAVLDVIETGKPQFRVGLPQARSAELKIGGKYKIDLNGRQIIGELKTLRPDIDPTTRSIVALLDLPPNEQLRFGAIADLVLKTNQNRKGFWIPLSALREGARGLWTLVTVEGGKTGLESVEILAIDNEQAFVRGTLKDGARVVKEGTHRLVPGTRVVSAGHQDQ